MEEAGDDVWQLDVRCRIGGGANRLALEVIAGTAKNEEVPGKARASLPLQPPWLSLLLGDLPPSLSSLSLPELLPSLPLPLLLLSLPLPVLLPSLPMPLLLSSLPMPLLLSSLLLALSTK